MQRSMIKQHVPLWLRRSHKRGGLSLMEAMASFLVMTIAAIGTLKTFALGRVGLEQEYEYRMAGELLRQKTEWIMGMIHQYQPTAEEWPGTFDQGDFRGEAVVIDSRTNIYGAPHRPVRGTIYYDRVSAVDDPTTQNTPLDWYDIHTWIEWHSPRQSAWLDGMSGPPEGRDPIDERRNNGVRIDFRARVVPTWIDK